MTAEPFTPEQRAEVERIAREAAEAAITAAFRQVLDFMNAADDE